MKNQVAIYLDMFEIHIFIYLDIMLFIFAVGNQGFQVWVRLLAMSRVELSVAIVWLISKCSEVDGSGRDDVRAEIMAVKL